MLTKKAKLQNFDDWVDVFHQWRVDIGYPTDLVGDYTFETKLSELESDEVEFGHFAGRPKWEKLIDVPDQRIRDALAHLIEYQGDTEFASVEQQKGLLERAPTKYDLESMIRVNREEMRHGWQMSYVLVTHFGEGGKRQAQRLLERRASTDNQRLLGAFNEPVRSWLDFFVYTDFIDRDGKYQLNMLSRSAFAPLARSMRPMLQEEAFHLLTGNTGLMRIVKAKKIPLNIVQKYFYKWLSTGADLFGQDESSSAHWAYEWGLKGRYDEHLFDGPPDLGKINELSRSQYLKEVGAIIDSLNRSVGPDEPKLRLPDEKFHRSIGVYADKTYSVTGELLSPEAYEKHLKEVLPTEEDEKLLIALEKEPGWIVDPQQAR